MALVLVVQVLVAAQPRPLQLPAPTRPVVLVGIAGLSALPQAAREAPWATRRQVSAAALSEPAPARGGCALDVWATLGAGRSTSVEPVCTATVSDRHVAGWANLVRASATTRPDARLGTLAGEVPGCVAAVGPDAALAAARSDGTVAVSMTFDAFLRAGSRTRCPLTLVDPGTTPLSVLMPLLRRPDATVVLVGVRRTASTQAVETLVWVGDAPGGWLTSPSTRRTGLVTLPDVTRTVVAASGGDPSSAPLSDGKQLERDPGTLSAATVDREVSGLQAQPHVLATATSALVGLAALGSIALLVAGRRRPDLTGILLDSALVLPAALALTGVQPRPWGPTCAATLVTEALAWTLLLAALVRRSALVTALPAPLLAAAATLVVLTADAATGGLLQRSSLLNPRPLDGGRWFGFGNTAFAVYAAAVLVVVGWLLDLGASAAATVLAALALACEASPTMGADLGGVLALTAPLLWLLVGDRRQAVGLPRLAAVVGAAVGLGAGVAGLDWLRGPQHWTHLGGFVQELLDGTAGAVLLRKGGAVLTSASATSGFLVLALTALSWWFVLRRRRRAATVFPALTRVVPALAATAVVGTLVNDSGVVVAGVLSVSVAVTVTALAHDAERRDVMAAWSPISDWPVRLVRAGSRAGTRDRGPVVLARGSSGARPNSDART